MAILSIQSHVTYGHAGNSAAVFPLQRLGREVWAVNTVEFSNHTGYKAWRGKVLDASLCDVILLGLQERGVLSGCEAVLSGYLGDASVGRAILNALKRVRAAAPDALYCCDPVMGDTGRGFYVSADIPNIFKNEMIPRADIITPNLFELEALTGIECGAQALLGDFGPTVQAVKALHAMGPRIVLVTSYRAENGCIGMLVSGGEKIWLAQTPELNFENSAGMAGSGDLTAAVFLSRYLESGDLKKSLELCAGAVYGIMERTKRSESRELLLVAAQDELVSPSRIFDAGEITGL